MVLWILLLVLAVLTLLVFAGQKKTGQSRSGPVLYALLSLLFLVVIAVLLRSCTTPRVKFVQDFYEVEAIKLGEAVAASVENGQVLVFLPVVDTDSQGGINKAHVKGIRSSLGDQGFEVTEALATDTADFDPSMPVIIPKIGLVHFQDTLAANPDATAIVSFDGFPPAYTKGMPPVFLGRVGEPEMARSMFESGGLQAYVKFRPGADLQAKPSRGMTLDEVFAMRYELVTR